MTPTFLEADSLLFCDEMQIHLSSERRLYDVDLLPELLLFFIVDLN